jgi:4-amino-4-deoxy-L-arabinose transferase-like glycosyltransferase
VALEMILSKNYAVPTIGAEYYYNKPPFYNWILAGIYQLSGNYSEFTTRLPAIIPMFLFAITIYLSVSYFLKDKRIAAHKWNSVSG